MNREERLQIIGGDRTEAVIKDFIYPGLAQVLKDIRTVNKNNPLAQRGDTAMTEIAPAAAALNGPQPCQWCAGTGYRNDPKLQGYAGGKCFLCKDGKVILSDRTKCVRAVRSRLIPDGDWRALTPDAYRRADMAIDALAHIESNSPDRFALMWRSIERGRIDEVISALVACYRDTF